MRILYDGYIYGLQRSGGINRYFYELIKRLPESCRPVILGDRPSIQVFPNHKNIKCIGHLPRILEPIAGIATRCFDVVHPTYYELTRPLKYSGVKTRCVVTIHDFIIDRYTNLFPKGKKVIIAQKQAIKRADAIICVSESTRMDLLARFPECENRCAVVPLASSMEFSHVCLSNQHGNVARPYCLYVGSRNFYKNFNWCLDAISDLKQRGLDLNLIVAGPSWTSDETITIRNSGVGERVELIEYPADAVLAALYKNAVALVYPSSYEGFGLPPLEAMTMGCPVIAQHASSLPEVIGDGGVLMQPQESSPILIADILAELLLNTSLRRLLSEKARSRAATFSWEKTAEMTFSIYRGSVA